MFHELIFTPYMLPFDRLEDFSRARTSVFNRFTLVAPLPKSVSHSGERKIYCPMSGIDLS